MPLPLRKLGTQGLEVSEQGLGCMGMTAFYLSNEIDPRSIEEENIQLIGAALDAGINFFDTAHIYQNFFHKYTNEELLGKAIKRYGREKFIVATKCSSEVDLTIGKPKPISGKAEYIRRLLSESLARLDLPSVDLYYMHRIPQDVPIEETMMTMKELVQEGKIKYIGLSECTPSELRRAHAVHPISCIQMEWSLNSRDIEDSVIPTARELGVGIVAYSPLGRGLLTGAITSIESLATNDYRRSNPRFADGNLEKNTAHSFFEIASASGCSPSQLALAWVLSRGDDVVPIPGTRNLKRLHENIAAGAIKLSPEKWQEVEASIPKIEGDRYPGMIATYNQRLE